MALHLRNLPGVLPPSVQSSGPQISSPLDTASPPSLSPADASQPEDQTCRCLVPISILHFLLEILPTAKSSNI